MKRRGIITFVVLSIVVFAGLALYGDFPELFEEISSFPVAYWSMALGLALANYAIRMVRWHYYLKLLEIETGMWTSIAIFMSGLSMAISPGRVGELAKSYFLRDKLGVPVALSSPAVVTERITDLIAVLLLSSWGLMLVPYGWAVALVILSALGLFIFFLVSPWGSEKALRLPLPRRWKPFLNTSRDAFRRVCSSKPLAIAVFLGALAWFAEGCGLWLVLRGLDTPAPLSHAVSIYAAATLLGAVTMLPGGLVGTEGGMVALLQRLDLTRTQASSATFIIRVCTLWFAVALGLVALVYVQVYMPKRGPQEAGSLSGHSDISDGTTQGAGGGTPGGQ